MRAPTCSPGVASPPWQEELLLLDQRLRAEQRRATVLRARNSAGHERAQAQQRAPKEPEDLTAAAAARAAAQSARCEGPGPQMC